MTQPGGATAEATKFQRLLLEVSKARNPRDEMRRVARAFASGDTSNPTAIVQVRPTESARRSPDDLEQMIEAGAIDCPVQAGSRCSLCARRRLVVIEVNSSRALGSSSTPSSYDTRPLETVLNT
jgi:hypothetical protein